MFREAVKVNTSLWSQRGGGTTRPSAQRHGPRTAGLPRSDIHGRHMVHVAQEAGRGERTHPPTRLATASSSQQRTPQTTQRGRSVRCPGRTGHSGTQLMKVNTQDGGDQPLSKEQKKQRKAGVQSGATESPSSSCSPSLWPKAPALPAHEARAPHALSSV